MLAEIIKKQIVEHGPITLSTYMDLCLQHPLYGYYKKATVLGADGDFTTAPEISQLFGECIGVFFTDLWQRMSPKGILSFYELGPGRGALLSDVLRVFKAHGPKEKDLEIRLLETNETLKKCQQNILSSKGYRVTWSENLDTQDMGAHVFILGNEFLDALSVDQYILTKEGWALRLVGWDNAKKTFCFREGPFVTENFSFPQNVDIGAIWEHSLAQCEILHKIGTILNKTPGMALFIDYGCSAGNGDSFQAVSKHRYVDPFARPGEHDLTCHVNFGDLARYMHKHYPELTLFGPINQGAFLKNMGIFERAKHLQEQKPEQRRTLEQALSRLTDSMQMGSLFKVWGISGLPISPFGF